MADAELVVVGNDGLDRIRRVALRAIPELLTGFKGDNPDLVLEVARAEVHAFMDAHGTTLATSTVGQLRRVIAGAFDQRERVEPELPDTGESDDEILAKMEAAESLSAKVAADLAGKVELLANVIETASAIGRGALMAGLSALAAAL